MLPLIQGRNVYNELVELTEEDVNVGLGEARKHSMLIGLIIRHEFEVLV